MANPKTKWVKLNGFNLTSHAQNRIVSRKIKKADVVDHFYSDPLIETPIRKSKSDDTDEYDRIGKKLFSPIAADTNNVKMIRAINKNRAKKYGLVIDNPKKRTFRRATKHGKK